jgi:hypothetical protein
VALETQEIIVEDVECWLAPLETAFPALTATPAGEWKKAGKKGILSHSEAGCTITLTKTTAQFTSSGAAAPIKSWVTERTFEAAFELADLSMETLALLADNVTVTTSGAIKSVSLPDGFVNHEYAAILRGTSSEEEGKKMQWKVPSCYNGATMAPKFAPKSGPAYLAVQLMATLATGSWVSVEAEG